ncbi:MAG: 4Fe-4S dicluster domain-containing protein [Candidatus Krumholzibacteriota bacterium]
MSARPAFIVDVNKCTGCHACAMACGIANDLPATQPWREVRTFNELHVPGVELMHLSLACNHCADAPCMEQCPALAYHRDEQTGAVLINSDACLGCRYCAWACPYGAPRFDESRGVMTKCNFCVDKQHEGGQPACVTSCPTGALTWGELPDEELVQDVPGFAQAGVGPSIRFEPLLPARRVPETTHPPAMPPWRRLRDKIVPHITLKHEWTLAVFTLLAAALVGVFTAWRLGSVGLDWRVFLGLGAAGMALSASHLGHVERSWRAALHLDESWLSREIVLIGGFLALAAGALYFGGWPTWAGWVAVALGFLTLAAIDRVYRVATIRGSGPLNSAHVLGTGLLLAAVWHWSLPVAGGVALVKLVLYATRRRSRTRLGCDVSHPAMGWLRAGTLLAGMGAMFGDIRWPALILILVGEMIDRGEFYAELEIPTPNSLLLDELEARPEAHAVPKGE